MSIDPSSRVATEADDGATFHRTDVVSITIARVVCEANCLPRKELYESWEVARRNATEVSAVVASSTLRAGHGLVAHLMLLLDDSSPSALCVDKRIPQSARLSSLRRARACLATNWAERVTYAEQPIEARHADRRKMSSSRRMPCGALTERRASRVRPPQVLAWQCLPCCHDEDTCDAGRFSRDGSTSRSRSTRRVPTASPPPGEHGYAVYTQLIPASITPKNRLLMGEPHQRNQVSTSPAARCVRYSRKFKTRAVSSSTNSSSSRAIARSRTAALTTACTAWTRMNAASRRFLGRSGCPWCSR